MRDFTALARATTALCVERFPLEPAKVNMFGRNEKICCSASVPIQHIEIGRGRDSIFFVIGKLTLSKNQLHWEALNPVETELNTNLPPQQRQKG